MKKIVSAVLLGVSLFNPTSVLAADIEDGFMRGIFQYLAKRRSMNLVAYSGEKVPRSAIDSPFIEKLLNPGWFRTPYKPINKTSSRNSISSDKKRGSSFPFNN